MLLSVDGPFSSMIYICKILILQSYVELPECQKVYLLVAQMWGLTNHKLETFANHKCLQKVAKLRRFLSNCLMVSSIVGFQRSHWDGLRLR